MRCIMRRFTAVSLMTVIAVSCAFAADSFPVTMEIDAASDRGPLKPIWRFFGADEPNYATMPHGRKLLKHLGEMSPTNVFFRTHNLLCTGDGTPALKWGSTNAYTEDEAGNPIYNWKILDEIFDAYLENGVRPYAQIGFMPQALSTHPDPYQHRWRVGAPYQEIYTGWAYPPKDYDKWGELVYQWVKHCVDRYGAAEVNTWYWETWNEPNIPYWQGTPEEFHKLHDYAIAAVRRALPTARVGGPDTAGSGGKFMRDFLEHCLRGTNYATGETGTPIDFLSFHAKGQPETVDGHVRMGIANQLRTIDDGFRIIASYPELKDKPIVIGESDPEGCAACQGPQLAYRNGTMYSSYTAASFARKHAIARKRGVQLEGALTWAFEFENHPYFAGFRSLATNGIDKPVLNVFRMMSRLGGRQLEVISDAEIPLPTILQEGVRQSPDVSALATSQGNQISILVWHYHDDDRPGPLAEVSMIINHLPPDCKAVRLSHYRVDETHSNAFTRWKALGSPQQPTEEQYAELDAASQLAQLEPSREVPVSDGNITLQFALPRAGVSLLVLELNPAAASSATTTPSTDPTSHVSPPSIPDKLVALTFDDSAKSHYTVVRPTLKQYGFGATFFITEGFDFTENKRDYMTWEEIAELHRDGFEIGNHTKDHLGITDKTVERLDEQLLGIEEKCQTYGIPKPVTFAWPGNAMTERAFPILQAHGIRFARRGGGPEFPYDEGRGFAYEPGNDHPLMVPSAGDARPTWQLNDLIRAVEQARDGKIAVLQFHGAPDTAHDWVSTSRDNFEAFMHYLATHQYRVVALRDLERLVDLTVVPTDPQAIITARQQQLSQDSIQTD